MIRKYLNIRILCIILSVLSLVLCSCDDSDFPDDYSVEGSNYGVVTTDGTYMYFSIDGCIFRENMDGSNRTAVYRKRIVEESDVLNTYQYEDIQYDNGYLYCYGSNSYGYKAFRINVNDFTLENVESFEDEHFKRRNINTTLVEEKGFFDSFSYVQQYNGYYWYRSKNVVAGIDQQYSLFRVNTVNDPKKVFNGVDIYCVYQGYIYYIFDGDLYRTDIAGNKRELLVSDIISNLDGGYPIMYSITTAGNWIYIEKKPDTFHFGKLYRAKIGEWNFELMELSDNDKLQYTNNSVIGQVTPTPSLVPTPSAVQTQIPIQTHTPTPNQKDQHDKNVEIKVELAGNITKYLTDNDYYDTLFIDFDNNGNKMCVDVYYAEDDASGYGGFQIHKTENKDSEVIATYTGGYKTLNYTIVGADDGKWYLQQIGGLSGATYYTIYEYQGSDFVEIASYSKDHQDYMVNHQPASEDEYQSMCQKYNERIYASTNQQMRAVNSI